jgi:hypothetical protein
VSPSRIRQIKTTIAAMRSATTALRHGARRLARVILIVLVWSDMPPKPGEPVGHRERIFYGAIPSPNNQRAEAYFDSGNGIVPDKHDFMYRLRFPPEPSPCLGTVLRTSLVSVPDRADYQVVGDRSHPRRYLSRDPGRSLLRSRPLCTIIS